MRVPIRIYNHVNLSTAHQPYDILQPVLNVIGKGDQLPSARVREVLDSGSPISPLSRRTSGIQRNFSGASLDSAATVSPVLKEPLRDPTDEVREYAMRLLESRSRRPLSLSAGHDMALSSVDNSIDDGGDGEPVNCREAVEVLTRNMRKGT